MWVLKLDYCLRNFESTDSPFWRGKWLVNFICTLHWKEIYNEKIGSLTSSYLKTSGKQVSSIELTRKYKTGMLSALVHSQVTRQLLFSVKLTLALFPGEVLTDLEAAMGTAQKGYNTET